MKTYEEHISDGNVNECSLFQFKSLQFEDFFTELSTVSNFATHALAFKYKHSTA